MSKIDTAVQVLQDRSYAAAHCLLYSCLQHQWSYRLRTCRGDNSILLATSKVDATLDRGLATYCSPNVFSDELLARRMRLPVRMNSFGIRSQTSFLAPVWAGCFIQACKAFTGRVDGLGEVVLPGSFPLLGRLFGDEAFHMGGRRFEAIVSNTPTPSSARSLMTHWADMLRACATSAEPGLGPASGPLSQGVHQTGLKSSTSEDSNDHTPSCPRLQQALREQLEQHQAETLDKHLRQLLAI